MVTANNYMFRSPTGHHQVVHPIKRSWVWGGGAVQNAIKLLSDDEISFIVSYTL